MSTVAADIISIIKKFLQNDGLEIGEETRLSDLHLDSLSMLELLFEIEIFFKVTINPYEYTDEDIADKSIQKLTQIIENLIHKE
jgi:acyl carrier protein